MAVGNEDAISNGDPGAGRAACHDGRPRDVGRAARLGAACRQPWRDPVRRPAAPADGRPGGADLRGVVSQPRRYVRAVVRLLQREHGGSDRGATRAGELYRAGGVRRPPADPVRAGTRPRSSTLGRLYRQSAGRFRRPRRGVDDPFGRADALGAWAADEPVVRTGRVGVPRTYQHGATSALGTGRPVRARSERHHRFGAPGSGGSPAHYRRVGGPGR